MRRIFASLVLLIGSVPCWADAYDRLGEVLPDDVGRKIWSAAVADDVVFAMLGSGGIENLHAFEIDGVAPGEPFLTVTDAFWSVGLSTARGMVHHEDALYLFTLGGLQAIDISDPRNPLVPENIPVGDRLFNGRVSGEELLTVGGTQLAIFNVAFPTNPVLVATHDFGMSGHFSVARNGDYLYTGWYDSDDSSHNLLRIYRFDGDTLVDEGSVEDGLAPGRAIEHLAVVNGRLVGCGTSGPILWSLSNPRRPVILDTATGSGRNCVIEGDHVIVNGRVWHVDGDEFVLAASFSTDSSATDGIPHHGDAAGGLVAVAQGDRVLLLEAAPASFRHAGGLSGLWIDFDAPGDGFNVIRSDGATTILFFGYADSGERIWLGTESLSGVLRRDTPITLEVFEFVGGTFATPAAPGDAITPWGTLEAWFSDCGFGGAILDGTHGRKEMDLTRLAQIDDSRCD